MVALVVWLRRIDPIKWIDDVIAISRYGAGHLLEWPSTAAAGADVELLLRRHGVRVYGRKYAWSDDDTLGCRVTRRQARYADGLLRGAGVPVVSIRLSKPIKPKHTWGRPARPVGLAGRIGQSFMGINPPKEK